MTIVLNPRQAGVELTLAHVQIVSTGSTKHGGCNIRLLSMRTCSGTAMVHRLMHQGQRAMLWPLYASIFLVRTCSFYLFAQLRISRAGQKIRYFRAANTHETLNTTLARHGHIACSPVDPSLAVSFQALALYKAMGTRCPQLSIQAFVRSLCDLQQVSCHQCWMQNRYTYHCTRYHIGLTFAHK